MANEHLFQPFLAAATFDLAQGDPNASLGGFKSSTKLMDQEGTFTSVTNDRVVIDTGLPAGDFAGAWVVFLDTNLNEVREVFAYDEGPNTLTFREDLPSTPLVSDRYWLFLPNGLFASFNADRSRRRATVHRLAYVYNDTPASLDSVQAYVKDIQAGPIICDVAMAVKNFAQNVHFDVDDLADEETAPELLDTFGGGFGDSSQDFLHKRSFAGSSRSPYGTVGAFGQKTIRHLGGGSVHVDRPIWVRLSFDPDSPIPLPSQAVFQVFIDADGVTITSFLVVVDIDGVPEVIVPIVDRRLRIAGGARLSCIVTDNVTPFEPVPGRAIRIERTSGPGTMQAQSDTVQRDDGEPIRRVYNSPTDPGQVGATVVFGFEVT
jgi:hypothetical protein